MSYNDVLIWVQIKSIFRNKAGFLEEKFW